MNSRREQIWVGLFVLVAAGLLIGTILAVAGTFSSGGIAHYAISNRPAVSSPAPSFATEA